MNDKIIFNDGKLIIMSLNDLNISLNTEIYRQRKRNEDLKNLIKMGVLAFRPNLVAFTGNILSADDLAPDFTNLELILKDILEPIIKSNINFTVISKGENHSVKLDLILKSLKELPNYINVENQKELNIYTQQIFNQNSFSAKNICKNAVTITELTENEPTTIKTKAYTFEELGLLPTSLGPLGNFFADSRNISLQKAATTAVGAIGALGAVKITKIFSNNK